MELEKNPFYWDGIRRVAEFVINESRGRPITVYPTMANGIPCASHIAEIFAEKPAGYRMLPFLVDKPSGQLQLPLPESLRRVIHKQRGNYHFIFDDATGTGKTVLTFYEHLTRYGIGDENIGIGSLVDLSGGVADICILTPYVWEAKPKEERGRNRSKRLAELKERGMIPRWAGYVATPSRNVTDAEVKAYSDKYLRPGEIVEFPQSGACVPKRFERGIRVG